MLDKVKEFIVDDEFQLIIRENSIYIKNYKRLISLEENYISFYTKHKKVIIKGNHLILQKIVEFDAIISGNIHMIEVQDER
jgi:hypothetical protein